MDYEIAFVKKGALFLKQGINSGFKKLNEAIMRKSFNPIYHNLIVIFLVFLFIFN